MNSYEYKIAGLDQDGKIIVLVDDTDYGGYSVALDFASVSDDGMLEVAYDFVSNDDIPKTRIEQLVEDVVHHIFEEIKASNAE